MSNETPSKGDPKTYSRREALASVAKYAAVLGGASVVALSADDAAAQAACSTKNPPWWCDPNSGGNGNGNGNNN